MDSQWDTQWNTLGQATVISWTVPYKGRFIGGKIIYSWDNFQFPRLITRGFHDFIASIIQLAVQIIDIASTSKPYPTLNVYCSYYGLSMKCTLFCLSLLTCDHAYACSDPDLTMAVTEIYNLYQQQLIRS